MTNKKTLLVGLDLRKPKIHKDFNISNTVGISTYLIKKNTIDEIILKTDHDNLYVVPSGPIPPNPAQLLETDRLKAFLDKVRKDFDYVIIDTPPIALVSDALIFSEYTDANIFVVRQNYSNKKVLEILNDLNKRKNMSRFNILINDFQLSEIKIRR